MATHASAVPMALLELGVLLVSGTRNFVGGLLEMFCWTRPRPTYVPSPLATSLPLVVQLHLSRYLSREDRHNMAAVFPSWRPFIDAQLPEHTPESRDKQGRRWILYLTFISRVHGFTFWMFILCPIFFEAGDELITRFYWLKLLDAYEYKLLMWRFQALISVANCLICFVEDTYTTLLLTHPMELLAHDPNLAPGANLLIFLFYTAPGTNAPDVALLSHWRFGIKCLLIESSMLFLLCIVRLLWHLSFTH